MQRPFEKQTMEIYEAFKQVGGMDYVKENGIAVRDILLAMQDAQSEEEFHDLAVQFKDAAVLPFYKDVVQYLGKEKADQLKASQPVLKLNKNEDLGTYDALSKRKEIKDSKYSRLVGVKQADGSEKMENKVALLQAIEDPQELAYMANELGVTPKALKAHVQNAWQTQQAELQKKTESELKKRQAKRNEAMVKNFEDSKVGFVADMMAPELTATMKKAISENGNISPMDVVKAGLKDAAVTTASAVIPGAIGGRVAGKIASKGLAHVANAAATGATEGAIELGRQAASDNFDMNAGQAGAVGFSQATIPTFLEKVAGAATKVGGKFAKIARSASKSARGLERDFAEQESEKAAKTIAEIVDAEPKTDSPIAWDEFNNKLNKALEDIEKHPNKAAKDVYYKEVNNDPDMIANFAENNPQYDFKVTTRDDVIKMAKDNDWKYGVPSKKEVEDMVILKNSDNQINSAIGEEYVNRMKAQYPATWQKYSETEVPAPKFSIKHPIETTKQKIDYGMQPEQIGKGIMYASPGYSNKFIRKQMQQPSNEPSEQLQRAMENDPALIQQWEAGFKPRTYDPLYEEWKRKFSKRF